MEGPRGPENSSVVGNVILISSQTGCTKRRKGSGSHTFWYETVDPELIWTIRVFRALRQYCTADQIFVHFANTFRPYRDRSTWDDYNQYRGPQGVRGSVFTHNTSPAPTEENSLGPDQLGDQQSSSEETHTPPSPAGEF